MLGHKIAVGALSAGLLIGGWSIRNPDEAPAPAPPTTVTSATPVDQPVQGLDPIDDVVALWQERADTQPLDYLSRTQLGLAYGQRGREEADLDDHERSEAAHRAALALNPSHQPAQIGLARALMAQHRFVEGRDLITGVLDADPGSLAALALLGDAHLELGAYTAASGTYADLIARERSAAIVTRLARLASIQTTPADAVALAEEALDLSSAQGLRPTQAAFYWFQLGHYRFVAGDNEGAIAAFESALELDPTHPAATEELAHTLASLGRTESAMEIYGRLVAEAPAADLHGRYAELLAADGQAEAAAEQEELGAAAAEATGDRYPSERRHLVDFYLHREPRTAVQLARQDIAERSDIGAHDTLAWALFHAGRIDEAAEAIEPALGQGTQDPRLRFHAAAIAAADGNQALARRHLEMALTLNPHFHPTEGPAAAGLWVELTGNEFGT